MGKISIRRDTLDLDDSFFADGALKGEPFAAGKFLRVGLSLL